MKEDIKESANGVVRRIREYSASQRNLWKFVPWFALEADGRTGYSEIHRDAYKYGYWGIVSTDPNGPPFKVYVDLATGELVNTFLREGRPSSSGLVSLAMDEDVIKLAFHMDELDAALIISRLAEKAKKPYSSYRNAKKQDAERRELRERLGVKRIFTRT